MDSKVYLNKIRIRRALEMYFDGLVEYAFCLQTDYGLSNNDIEGVLKMTVASKLSSLSKMWKKVTPVQPAFSNVPENDYVAELKEMKLTEAKKSGRLQVESTYEIADGDYEGKTVKRFDGIDQEEGAGYFKGYCEIIGMDIPEEIELLQEACDEFVANTNDLFEISVKQNDKYTNVYVNGISEFVKASADGEADQVVEEEPEEQVEEQVEEQEEVGEEEPVEEEVAVEEEVQEVVQPVRAKAVVNAGKAVANASKPALKMVGKTTTTTIKAKTQTATQPTETRKVTVKKK